MTGGARRGLTSSIQRWTPFLHLQRRRIFPYPLHFTSRHFTSLYFTSLQSTPLHSLHPSTPSTPSTPPLHSIHSIPLPPSHSLHPTPLTSPHSLPSKSPPGCTHDHTQQSISSSSSQPCMPPRLHPDPAFINKGAEQQQARSRGARPRPRPRP